MPGFGSSGQYGFGDGGGKDIVVGKIEDIKSAPKYGERRVIVREKSGRRSTMAVDMPSDCSAKLERKETYRFRVEEKEDTRGGYKSASRSSSFRIYHCDDAPEPYNAYGGWESSFGRSGSHDSDGGGSGRFGRKFSG